MIITKQNGRRKSITTVDEMQLSIDEMMDVMSPWELKAAELLGNEFEENELDLHEALETHTYREVPVSMEQFLDDPYYLGEACASIYPAIREDMIQLFERPYREFLSTGGIGVGKCVSGDSEIYDPVLGERLTAHRMSLASGGTGCAAFSHCQGGTVSAGSVSSFSGMKKTGEMVLSSGKSLRLSPDHTVLTPYGYSKIGDLKPGDLIATARSLPPPVNCKDICKDEVKWVAYMLTDGGSTQASMSFTSESEVIHREFEDITGKLGDPDESGRIGCSFVRKMRDTVTVRPLGVQWLRRKYSFDKKSVDKRVPADFYGLSDYDLGLFLNRVWSCDGWVCKRSGRSWEVGIALGSENFVRDLQILLLRASVHSRIRYRRVKYCHKGEVRESDAWSLQVLGKSDLARFFAYVGLILGKEEVCEKVISDLSLIVSNTNVDITPVDRSVMSRIRSEIGPIPKKAYWPRPAQGSFMGHNLFRVFSANYILPEWCRWWGDLFWDRLESYTVRDIYEPVYDLEVPAYGNFAPGGIIIHNSYSASIAICRLLYEYACMISPQRTFGLSSGSTLVIPLVSKNLALSRDVLLAAVNEKIKDSPYFMEKCAPDFRKDYTLFPNNVRVIIASYLSDRFLGTDLVSCVMDETNFPPRRRGQQIATGFGQHAKREHFDIVEKMYRKILRRIKSRFQKAGGGFNGMAVLVSSAATVESFTERRIRERKDDPDFFVRDHTQWTVRPKGSYSGEVFYVLCSTSAMKSRILREEEYDKITDDYLDENDAFVMDIPVEFLDDFKADMENALRDIAGFSTQAISQYIQRPKMIKMCTDPDREHPFDKEAWVSGGPGSVDWNALSVKYIRRLPGGYEEDAWKPRRNPSALRWCHIDTSTSGDCTGFCIGHVDRWVEVVRTDPDGGKMTDLCPYYIIDFMLRIYPPPAEQIYMPDVRVMLYHFMVRGFRFIGFSSDTYQCLSGDTRILTSRGLICIEDVIIGDYVMSRSGPRRVLNKWFFGERDTVKIVTNDGDILEGTDRHKIEVQVGWKGKRKPLLAVENGRFNCNDPVYKWVRIGDLKVGDVVRMSNSVDIDLDVEDEQLFCDVDFGELGRGYNNHYGRLGRWLPPLSLNSCFAEWLGFLWGDGDVTGDGVRITCHKSERRYVDGLFFDLFGVYPSYREISDRGCILSLSSRWFVRWMDKVGVLKDFKRRGAGIPEIIFRSPSYIRASFLRGLLGADGNVSKSDGRVSLSTKYFKLANDVRVMVLSTWGISSKITENFRSGYGAYGVQYVVGIRGSRRRFVDSIGVGTDDKSRILNENIEVKGRKKMVKIASVSRSMSEVYDLEIEDDHSYMANGFVSHNSVEMHQQVRRKGITPRIISTDTTMEPYDELKSAFYEKRIEIYHYQPFIDEFKDLEYDRVVGKVDHPTGGCFVGRTRVPLLDGNCPCIEELVGKEIWVYSCLTTGEIVPGLARGRLSKKTNDFVDVVLDSGAVERCTPEHLWLLRDGTYKMAKDLFPGVDRLMPINRNWPVNVASRSGENHKVRYVIPVKLSELEPVYDLEVDRFSNFALSSGVFVHNSKDVSDAVAGVVLGLKMAAEKMPMQGQEERSKMPPHKDAWVTGKIPADRVDVEQVRAMRDGDSAEDFIPIFFGED